MRSLFVVFGLAVASPVYASSYQFDLLFESDNVVELQAGFDAPCLFNNDCYPDGFRLPTGFFADLEPGQAVKANLDTVSGIASIAGWSVPGDLFNRNGALASFLSIAPFGETVFTNEKITVTSEGPRGANPSGFCDPSDSNANLPDGFCGFFGYEASFDVVNVTEFGATSALSEVPLPAGGVLLLSGLALMASRRKSRKT